MRKKLDPKILFKSFISTALLMTACGKPYEVYDATTVAIQKEFLLNKKTETLEVAAATTTEIESNDLTNENEISDDSIVADFKNQIESLIERLQKLDSSLLPDDAAKRRDENIHTLKELLNKAYAEDSESIRFRENLVTLRRAAIAHQAQGISEEEKQMYQEHACRAMKAHLEKNDFPDERLKNAIQSDFNKKCQ